MHKCTTQCRTSREQRKTADELVFVVFQDTFLFHCDQLQLCGPASLFFPQDEPPHAFLTVLHSEAGKCYLCVFLSHKYTLKAQCLFLFDNSTFNLSPFFPAAIPVFDSSPSLSPLYQLIVHSQRQLLEEGSSTPPPSYNMHFYSVSRHTSLIWSLSFLFISYYIQPVLYGFMIVLWLQKYCKTPLLVSFGCL